MIRAVTTLAQLVIRKQLLDVMVFEMYPGFVPHTLRSGKSEKKMDIGGESTCQKEVRKALLLALECLQHAMQYSVPIASLVWESVLTSLPPTSKFCLTG